MTYDEKTLHWLLEGDPSVAWQVQRDLFDEPASTYEIHTGTRGHRRMGGAISGISGSWGNLGKGTLRP